MEPIICPSALCWDGSHPDPKDCSCPKVPACKGNRDTWDAGWGLCETYKEKNQQWCSHDQKHDLLAAEVCSECGLCEGNETAPTFTYMPPSYYPGTTGDPPKGNETAPTFTYMP